MKSVFAAILAIALSPLAFAQDDIIAVAANPLEDVTALEDVGFVMQGGEVYSD